ncbi:MAG: hypothetical protein AB7N65_13770, partial [Vicinamibacterales bacterium]
MADRARGSLLLLCAWLGIWQPLNLAGAAAEAIAALPVRGWPLGVLLTIRVVVIAVGVGAAVALWHRRPAAIALARIAVVLSAAVQLL